MRIEETMLSQASLEKDFTSIKWQDAQNKWVRAYHTTSKYKQQYWGGDKVIGVQQYTYDIWKARNKVLHRYKTSEVNRKKKEKNIGMHQKSEGTVSNALSRSEGNREETI